MKMFKKVLTAVLVGAMALTMMVGCGKTSSKTEEAVNAAGKTNSYAAETNKAMDGLQSVTSSIKGDTPTTEEINAAKEKLATMSEFSFNGGSGYDLYIWTNNSTNRKNSNYKYAYLMKVTSRHLEEANLEELLSKEFIAKGEFKGTDDDYAILRVVLKDAGKDVGMTISNVYGKDVLLVAVKAGATVSNLGQNY